MAINEFSKAATRIPSSIGTINVFLKAYIVGGQIKYKSTYEVEVLDQDGNRIIAAGDAGDLIPHLTQAQAAWLIQFMTDLRTKAQSEFL